jgi:hypothetical protein
MRELWNTQMWPLFLFPDAVKIKQLEEVLIQYQNKLLIKRFNYL